MDYKEQTIAPEPGVRLFVRTAVVPGPVKAEVILTHGRGEHSGRYDHVAEDFARHGYRLWSYDLRGHGRSNGTRGDLISYGDLLGDLKAVVGMAGAGEGAVFLLGHSLGGQITLNFLLAYPNDCKGAIIASPYLRLAFVPKWWRMLLARATHWIWPGMRQTTVLPPSKLSRDHAHLSSLPGLDLMHHQISARMFYAINRAGTAALEQAPRLRIPLLLIHGSGDQVTSAEATREFFEAAGSKDKTLMVYPDMLHETHNDIGREKVMADMISWMEARLGGGGAIEN